MTAPISLRYKQMLDTKTKKMRTRSDNILYMCRDGFPRDMTDTEKREIAEGVVDEICEFMQRNPRWTYKDFIDGYCQDPIVGTATRSDDFSIMLDSISQMVTWYKQESKAIESATKNEHIGVFAYPPIRS